MKKIIITFSSSLWFASRYGWIKSPSSVQVLRFALKEAQYSKPKYSLRKKGTVSYSCANSNRLQPRGRRSVSAAQSVRERFCRWWYRYSGGAIGAIRFPLLFRYCLHDLKAKPIQVLIFCVVCFTSIGGWSISK